MILVTVTAGMLSVRLDSMLIAIIGLAGGFMTPVLLDTVKGHLPAFYSYMLLLSIGILFIARYRQWRLLNYLGFVFTYVLFIVSLEDGYNHETDFVLAMTFLTALFVIHAFIVYWNNIFSRVESTTLEILHLVANAGVYGLVSYGLIHQAHGRPYPALMSLGVAIFFVLHVFVFISKKIRDQPLLTALIALSGAFTTWTLPLFFEKEVLTVSLALLALTFLWLGQKIGSNFLKNFSYVIYVTVFFRLAAWDFPRNYDRPPATYAAIGEYWKLMSERLLNFGVSIASVIIAFFLQQRMSRPDDTPRLPDDNDVPEIVAPTVTRQIFYWAAVLLVFIFLVVEFNGMLSYYQPLRLPVLTLLWCFLAAFLFRHANREEGLSTIFWIMCGVIFVTIAKIFSIDLHSWQFSSDMVYLADYTPLFGLMRLLDFGVVMVLLFAIWAMMSRRKTVRSTAAMFGYAGLFLLFIYTSFELNSFLYWKSRDFQDGGITILWAAFAVAYIAGGIWKSVSLLRYAGLGLVAVVIGKVFLYDLREMEIIVRVVAFIAVGVILLLGSFAYIYSNKKFLKEGTHEKP